MTEKVLKLWEAENMSDYANRRAVPGGWLVNEWNAVGHFTTTKVDDPTAPHCQPTPPEGPPMTRVDLAAWLTRYCGEPTDDGSGSMWTLTHESGEWPVYFDRTESSDEEWAVPWCDYGLPASIAGPALWAAHHRYGVAE